MMADHNLTGGCTNMAGKVVSNGSTYVPGPDYCMVCKCDTGRATFCRAVLCQPRQDCKSFRIGSSCCDFICLDEVIPRRPDGAPASPDDENNLGMQLVFSGLLYLFAVVHAQMDWMNNAKDFFSNTIQNNLKNDIINTVREKGGKLLDPAILTAIFNGNLSSLDAATLNTKIPKEVYPIMGMNTILTIGKDKLESLLSVGVFADSPAFQQHVRNFIAVNVSQSEVITKLDNILKSNNGEDYPLMLLLRDSLGRPETWNKDNITNLRHILFRLPISTLMAVRTNETVEAIRKEFNMCLASSGGRSNSCPSSEEIKTDTGSQTSKYMQDVKAWLDETKLGPPSQWTFAIVSDQNFLQLTPAQIMRIPEDILLARKNDLITAFPKNQNLMDYFGRPFAEKLMRKEGVMSKSDITSVKNFYNEMNDLQKFIYESDLPAVAKTDQAFWRQITENTAAAIKEGTLGISATSSLMQWCPAAEFKNFTKTEAQNIGTCRLTLYPGGVLNQTLNTMEASGNEMKDLLECLAASSGAATPGKLRMLSNQITAYAKNGNSMDYMKYPVTMVKDLPLQNIDAMTNNEAMQQLMDLVDLKPYQIQRMLQKLDVQRLKSLPTEVRASVPLARVERDISNNLDNLKTFVFDMPASSPVGMLAAPKLIQNGVLKPSPDTDLVPFMGSAEVARAANTTFFELLRNIAAPNVQQPTREACHTLNRMFVNITMAKHGLKRVEEVFNLLFPTQLQEMPPCVLVAFGEARLRSMNPHLKEALMMKLQELGNGQFLSDSIPWSTYEMIVEQGLSVMSRVRQVTTEDVEKWAAMVVAFPSSYIEAVTPEAARPLLVVLNEVAASQGDMPCLGQRKRRAIQTVILNTYGQSPEFWQEIKKIACLLYVLEDQYLYRISEGGMVSATCPLFADQQKYASFMPAKMMSCPGSVAADERAMRMKVADMQRTAYVRLLDPSKCLKRRKRAITQVPLCDRAYISGTADVEEAELRSLSREDMNMCLRALGSRPMTYQKANALFERVLELEVQSSPSLLPKEMQLELGYGWRGLTSQQLTAMEDDLVAMLGSDEMMLSDAQIEKVALAVVQFSSPTKIDLINRILCGFPASNINKLDANSLIDALPIISNSLADCKTEVLAPLSKKVIEGYKGAKMLDKAKLREMNVLASAFAPEDLSSIEDEAFAGITAPAIRKMPTDTFKMLKTEQIENMNYMAALAVSPQQENVISEEMKQALTAARQLDNSAAV